MAVPSLDQFSKAIVAAGLMSADELKAIWGGWPTAERPKDAAAFAQRLVELKKLNDFQAKELLEGRGARLVMGDYALLAKIGEGGMGQVFKAQHRRMNRIVALKVMSAAAMKDEAAIKRFQREVHAAARLEHPNIVTAYDSGEAGNVKYLVMQFVDGGDLSDLVKKNGPLPVERAANYVLQTARGLAFAHGEGVIHRDIKPANLLLDKKGVVKILDMGLARIENGEDGLTATEQVMGTVDYMSPEQASNTKSADARSDIYSLGCTLWFLLTGKKAYEGDSMIMRLMAHRDAPLPSLVKARDDVPWTLEQAFHKMIAKRAEDRFQSMDEVAAALEPFVAGGGPASGMGSSIGHGGAPNAELSAFLKTVGPGPKTQAKPGPSATNVAADATAQFVKAEVETDPKSEMIVPPLGARQAAKPQAKGSGGKKPPGNKNLILAGASGGALLVLLGVWFIFRGPNGEEIARVQLPDGGSVTVQQTVSAGTTPGARAPGSPQTLPQGVTPSSTISFFTSGATPTGAPNFISTTSPSALQIRWPLAASKPTDIQWLVGLGAEVTLRTALPSINSSVDRTIKSATEIPAGAATIVGVHFMGKAARVTDADLARLCGFVDLESLSFDNGGNRSGPLREITGQGWGKLASLKHLRSLQLEGCRPVTVLPDFMSSLTSLESLNLQYADAAEWARAAAAAPALKRINAYRTQLGDDGLAHLEKRTSLQQIDLRDSRVTQAAVDRFAAAVPQCLITWGEDKNPTVIEPRVPPPSAVASTAAPPGRYALQFDGAGDEVVVDSLKLEGAGPYTLEMALTWEPGSSPSAIYLGHGDGIRIDTLSRNHANFQAYSANIDTRDFPSPPQQAHFALVYTDKQLLGFRDGRLFKTVDASQAVAKSPQAALMIGKGLKGRIEMVRISSTARYAADYTPTLNFAPDPDTLALYRFDQPSGDVLQDASGHGRHGRIVGASWVLPDGSPMPTTAPTPAGVVFLDDLTETAFDCKGLLGKYGQSRDGKDLDWLGQKPSHSLFTHPVGVKQPAWVTYALDGRYAEFRTTVGAYLTPDSALTFRILGDDKLLWESKPQAAAQVGVDAVVDVRGVKMLKLEVVTPGSVSNAHALWIDPRLTSVADSKSPTSPPPAVFPFDAATALKHQGAWAQHLGVPVEFTNTVGMKFRLIPPGEFQMGLGPEFTDEELILLTGVKDVQGIKKLLPARPAHPVRITRPFYMQVEEVTSGRYRDVVGQLRPEMEQDPNAVLTHWVAWPDAISFCNRLSEREGKRPAYRIEGAKITPIDDADGYRLPTEAQWEYACRAGTNTLWYFGNDGSGGIREFRDRYAPPNPFGLTGLYGGSSEWCWDAPDLNPYSVPTPSPRDDPREDVGSSRIKRGGSGNDGGGADRVTVNSFVRSVGSASEPSNYTGFGRVVLPIPLPATPSLPAEPRTSVSGAAANPSLTVGALPEQTPTNTPAAPRWPLAPSKPEDIVWLQGLQATLTLRSGPATDVVLKPTDAPPAAPATIVGISFDRSSGTAVTDDSLKRVATLVDLESLACVFDPKATVPATKDGLPQLAALKNLRRLAIGRIGPADTDPAFLAALTQLESLSLHYATYPDWERHVARLSSLQELRLHNVDRAKLEELASLPRLTSLSFGGYANEHAVRFPAAQRFAKIAPWCRITLVGMDGDHGKQMIIEPTAPPPNAGAAVGSQPILGPAPTIDLLPLIDVKRDAVVGTWSKLTDGVELAVPNGPGVLELPYAPPEEYDFEIEFSPTGKGLNVNQYLLAQGSSFAWKLNSHGRQPPLHGFELLDGKQAKDRPEASTVIPIELQPGMRYRSRVEVRRGSLRAFLDDKEIVAWTGDFKRFTTEPINQLPHPERIGIGSYKRGVKFYAVSVREVLGRGTFADGVASPAAPGR